MKLLLLELAINTDIQEKLRQEINEFYEKHHGNLDYDLINQMKYMDMVISGNIMTSQYISWHNI